jgi:D-alanine--(R)-lactate ligase
LKLGILFGGRSEEHPVSIKSAQEVAQNLDLDKYEPIYIGITTNGAWLLCDSPTEGWEGRGLPAVLSPDRGTHGLLVLGVPRERAIRLDLAFPVLHGRFGEDGAIQGLLELSGIPYVGCDIQSSALCMDKSLAYLVARSAGIATPNVWTISAAEQIDPRQYAYPVFVKPARSGSSFGVTKVERAEDLSGAIAAAAVYDAKLLVEEAVDGIEVGCAVLGNGEELLVGAVDQINLTHGFFRIHQESSPESGSENSHAIVPADIPKAARDRVQQTAKALYQALGCRGLARIDMFLTAKGEVVLNEINTLPGMTSYSRYPRMMSAAGLSLTDVIDRVVSLAMAGPSR